MRPAWLSGGLLMGVLLVSASDLSAQDRRSSAARRAEERADSVRRLRDRARDSARRVTPTETRRQRQEVQREKQQAEDETRRRVPADERTTPVTPRTVITATRPDTTAVRPAARADTAGVLRIVETTPDSVRTEPPRRTRPRALVMRLTNREDAPMFCQNGSGHPVYGRDWCFERGFRLGAEWRRERVRDMTLTRVARGTPIDRALLEQMLGSELIEQIEDSRTELQLEQPLSGSWVESPAGGFILRIQAGDQPIAEVADRNRDGTIDTLWRRVPR
jgi:hypothetical protein